MRGVYLVPGMGKLEWEGVSTIPSRAYKCGHCGLQVASSEGYNTKRHPTRARSGPKMLPIQWICICPHCRRPTYFDYARQIPGVPFGDDVESLPKAVTELYDEARRCMTVDAYTASAIVCRKLLMNVAVDQGAKPGKSFACYVGWLLGMGKVPASTKEWVDRIREMGNEAAHEIRSFSRAECEDLLTFVEMLLRIVYEFPAKASSGQREQG